MLTKRLRDILHLEQRRQLASGGCGGRFWLLRDPYIPVEIRDASHFDGEQEGLYDVKKVFRYRTDTKEFSAIFNGEVIEYFEAIVPNFALALSGPEGSAVILSGIKKVGVIMPLREHVG